MDRREFPQVPTRAVAVALANHLEASLAGKVRSSEANKKHRLGLHLACFALYERTRPKAFKSPAKLMVCTISSCAEPILSRRPLRI